MTIAQAQQNPRVGEIVDWPYEPAPQPGTLLYQNPDVFLQGGEKLADSQWADKAPQMTELLNRYRNEFFALAMGYLRSAGVTGDYHEYGCYSATTFRMALTHASLMDLPALNLEMRFHAFDSFQGLPEVEADVANPQWTRGSMAMSESEFLETIERHGVMTDRISTYPGFYSDSLTQDLQQKFLERPQRIALVNIDCDLYESAVDVLQFIGPLLQIGSMVYFDDWFCGYHGSGAAGVQKAFQEFAGDCGWSFSHFRDCGWWGRAFIVTGRMD